MSRIVEGLASRRRLELQGSLNVGRSGLHEEPAMKTVAVLLSFSVCSIALVTDAAAQSREACRTKCGYVESFGPDTGKASQTPRVNACYRKCMQRTPRAARTSR